MSPTFRKIKSYYLIKAIVSAIVLGLALTFFAVGGTLLTLKLLSIPLNGWWYVLIGFTAFVSAFLPTFFICKKSDASIAKMLDAKYSLEERVQTMLENENGSSVFVELQREDAEYHLSLIERSVYRTASDGWIMLVSFLLSLVLFVVSLVIPTYKAPEQTPEVFSIKEWQTIALDNLISSVETGEMSPTPRELIATDLVELRESLYEIEDDKIITLVDEAVMTVNVCASITTIDDAVENYNSYKDLYNSIRSSEDASVKNFARAIAALDVTERLTIIKSDFTVSEEEYEQLKIDIVGFVDTIRASFATTQVPQDDQLRVAIEDFLTAVKNSATATGGTHSQLQSDIESIFTQRSVLLNEALAKQKNDRAIANYAINELISIFSIKNPPPFGGEALAGVGNGNDEIEEAPVPGGPPDDDLPKYGSDDLIYDPKIEDQREYGEILTEQTSKKDDTVSEQGTSPELEELIDDYFSALAGTMPMPSEPNDENQ